MLPDIVNFNTSYVVIKLFRLPLQLRYPSNFNTSYVVIKLKCTILIFFIFKYFNTSYVVIKPLAPVQVELDLLFQYILCCY